MRLRHHTTEDSIPEKRSPLSTPRPTLRPHLHLSTLLFILCIFSLPSAFAQHPTGPSAELPTTPTPQPPAPPSTGTITGTVTDRDGDFIPGATVTLTVEAQPPANEQQAISGGDGNFSFTNVAQGSFELTISAPGFTTQQTSGSLQAGQRAEIPQISMPAAVRIDVEVTASQRDIAQDQIAVQEKQRVFGLIPNFYVSYDRNPAPLVPKQKFELAWKISADPINFAMTGLIAGVQHSQNTFGGYGRGAQGYAKRYGAAYANDFIGTMISNAILPTVFKQDPRYFYKGTGSIGSRALYAIANAVICKGDNGHWQTNYSNIIGTFAAGSIANLYYPPADRDGAKLAFEETLVGLAAGAGSNLFQEFLIRRITPHAHHTIELRPKS